MAHSMAQTARYRGNADEFYCPTPSQRILTAELEWKPAGDLKVGDKLIGFDEQPTDLGAAGNRRRKYRPAYVTHTRPVKRDVWRLEMADGRYVDASAEHPWLVATKQSGNQRWASTKDIAVALAAGRPRFMHRFLDTWTTDTSRDGGWLAGLWDGEGYLSYQRRGTLAGVSQNPGAVLEEAERQMAARGIKYTNTSTGAADVRTLQVKGGWREIARLFGTVRPLRLLNKFGEMIDSSEFDKQMDGKGEPSEIIGAYHLGEQWVAGIETSTHTYLCEGYAAHNSVAEHSVLVASLMREVVGGDPFEGILHDAAESILPDVSAPFKQLLPDLRREEKLLDTSIRQHFMLPAKKSQECTVADWLALYIEASQIVPERGLDFVDPYGLRSKAMDLREGGWYIKCLGWREAKQLWLDAYAQLKPV
jgi:hypothetical protein